MLEALLDFSFQNSFSISTVKMFFTMFVVRDHLPFMTKVPHTDHSVQEGFCGEQLPLPNLTSDRQILQAQNHLHANVPEYGTIAK